MNEIHKNQSIGYITAISALLFLLFRLVFYNFY